MYGLYGTGKPVLGPGFSKLSRRSTKVVLVGGALCRELAYCWRNGKLVSEFFAVRNGRGEGASVLNETFFPASRAVAAADLWPGVGGGGPGV